MKNLLLALVISWQGLFAGVEQTAWWRTPLAQPGVSATIVGFVGIGKVSLRVGYIQPLQKHGLGPSLQVGASVRIF